MGDVLVAQVSGVDGGHASLAPGNGCPAWRSIAGPPSRRRRGRCEDENEPSRSARVGTPYIRQAAPSAMYHLMPNRAPRTEVCGSSFSLGGLFSVGSTPRAPKERAKTAAASRGPPRTCASAGTATAASASTATTRRPRIDQDIVDCARRVLSKKSPLDCKFAIPDNSVDSKPFVVSYGYTEHSRQHHADLDRSHEALIMYMSMCM